MGSQLIWISKESAHICVNGVQEKKGLTDLHIRRGDSSSLAGKGGIYLRIQKRGDDSLKPSWLRIYKRELCICV